VILRWMCEKELGRTGECRVSYLGLPCCVLSKLRGAVRAGERAETPVACVAQCAWRDPVHGRVSGVRVRAAWRPLERFYSKLFWSRAF
jgi:hypothetical protein